MDRKAFYDNARASLFHGVLTHSQVTGIESILDFWENPPVKPDGEFARDWAIRTEGWLAYMLATVFHETAQKMEPISEYGDDAYFTKHYDNRSDLGNGPGDGPRFKGRGFVQLTGRNNYNRMTSVVRHFYPTAPDFTESPESARVPMYAAVIMFDGMFTGLFTGKALKNYIGDPAKGQTVDYVGARHIINGTDRAQLIAGYAQKFEAALTASKAMV